MKFIKKAPLFFILLSTGILLTLLALAGKDTLYAQQEHNPWKEPVVSVLFTGINDDIYPWQLFEGSTQESISAKVETSDFREDVSKKEAEEAEAGGEDNQTNQSGEVVSEGQKSPAPTPITAAVPTMAPTPEPTPYSIKNQRLKPIRQSTQEEYLNHISADIYGDAGVIRAASYEFVQVDESYFDDALFIGDSRTVGLHDYTDLAEHADFLCETSLTVYKIMETNFDGEGTLEEVLTVNDYGKIYLMVGINELGRGTTEDFMEKYTEVIDRIHELEPEALIFIQGIMRVSEEKSIDDKIFNNNNIIARNNAIATLADNIQVFYIDVNEVVCDESGYLSEDYTFDQIHLLGVYNDIWKQFLLNHGVSENRKMN